MTFKQKNVYIYVKDMDLTYKYTLFLETLSMEQNL